MIETSPAPSISHDKPPAILSLIGDTPEERGKTRMRVMDQPVDQRRFGIRVVPRAHRLARRVVVMRHDVHHTSLGNQTPDPPDRGHQLRDRVLSRDRVIEQRRVQRPTRLAFEDARRVDDCAHGVEDLQRIVHALLQRAAILILAAVGQRREGDFLIVILPFKSTASNEGSA